MDWGICQYLDLDGEIHKAPAFVMILSHSRAKYVKLDFPDPLKAVKGYDSYTVIFVGEISPVIITEKGDYDYVKLIELIAGIYRMVSMISPIYIVCGTRPLV